MSESSDVASSSLLELRAALSGGSITSRGLVRAFLERIDALDRNGPRLNSIIEVNPEADAIAARLDGERRDGRVRGPLHGIPIILKDNVESADEMSTTAGSLALLGSPAGRDSTVAGRLRAAGAILLAKANMSEWANIRSDHSSSGWCARNGQSRNPHILDRSPSGSSSGSAIAVAAGFAPVAIGTETDGSIVSPASACGVVGLKPTVGLVSRAGVIPISTSQDTVGPLSRSVADAALILGVLAGPDPRDGATGACRGHYHDNYTRFLEPDGLRGARIGVARGLGFGVNPRTDAVLEEALAAMRDAGAIIVDPVEIGVDLRVAQKAEMEVLLYELKDSLNAFLANRRGIALDREGFESTLAGIITFNEAHRDVELKYFGQEIFEQAEAKGPLTEGAYLEALATSRRLARTDGLDRTLASHELDALVAPSGSPARPIDLVNGDGGGIGSSGLAAIAGYPLLSVPAGFVADLPVNLTFMGRAFDESRLLRLAFAFEQATQARRSPRFISCIAY